MGFQLSPHAVLVREALCSTRGVVRISCHDQLEQRDSSFQTWGTHDETTQRPPKQITISHDRLGCTGCIEDSQQLFQVILHQTVKEDLVLITHGSEKGVLEDDGGLLLELVVGSSDPTRRAKRSESDGEDEPSRIGKLDLRLIGEDGKIK